MNKRLLFTRVLASICFAFLLFSSFKNQDEKWYCDDLKNTYQIQVSNTRRQITVPADICELVRSNRKKSESVDIVLYENIVLHIFPEDQIEGTLSDVPQIVYL